MTYIGNGSSRALSSCRQLSHLAAASRTTRHAGAPSANEIGASSMGRPTSILRGMYRHGSLSPYTPRRPSYASRRTIYNEVYSESPRPTEDTVEDNARAEQQGDKPWEQLWGSYSRMLWESNIVQSGNSRDDEPMRSIQTDRLHDFDSWAELIQFRTTLNGYYGGLELFRILAKASRTIPTQGPGADRIWTLLLNEALRDRNYATKVMSLITLHHKRRGAKWEKLYSHIMSSVLATEPRKARAWHQVLQTIGNASEQELTQVARQTSQRSRVALVDFALFYRSLPEPKAALRESLDSEIEHHHPGFSGTWRQLLTDMRGNKRPKLSGRSRAYAAGKSQSDPAAALALNVANSSRSSKKHLAKSRTELDTKEHDSAQNVMSQQEIVQMVDHIRGFTPKSLSDNLAARAFATTAFSLDAIIGALTTIGLNTLGPQALRELAIRCDTTTDLVGHLQKLEEKHVLLADTRYCKFVHWVALTGQTSVFRSILACDLHPDAFEEEDTQEQLAKFYLEQNDKPQLTRTLVFLGRYFPTKSQHSWNLFLALLIKERDVDGIKDVISRMRSQHLSVDIKVLKKLYDWLPRGQQAGYARTHPSQTKGTSTRREQSDAITPVINICTAAAKLGVPIPLSLWRCLVQELGMAGRLRELESLAMWLATRYRWNKVRDNKMRHAQLNVLSSILQPPYQRAIVAWGFKTIGFQHPLYMSELGFTLPQGISAAEQRWDRGLLLLRELSNLGLMVKLNEIRKECRIRLVLLFDSGVSARIENTISKHANVQTLRQMVDRINEIWDGRIFPEIESVADADLFQYIVRDEASVADADAVTTEQKRILLNEVHRMYARKRKVLPQLVEDED